MTKTKVMDIKGRKSCQISLNKHLFSGQLLFNVWKFWMKVINNRKYNIEQYIDDFNYFFTSFISTHSKQHVAPPTKKQENV